MIKKILPVVLIGLTSPNLAHAETAKQVVFHDAKTAREWKIIGGDLYKSFIEKNPDIDVLSSVVDLDGKGIGSIFVQFNSPKTCNSDGCVTTVVHYNQKEKSWNEILNHRTKAIWLGGVSPTQAGAGMKEIFTSDRLMWRWIGTQSYYPDLRSIGKLWPDSVPAYGTRNNFALNNFPDIIPNSERDRSKYSIQEIPVNLNGIGGQYVMIYNYMPVCSSMGCPFLLISGGDKQYTIKGSGIINELGATLPNTTTGPDYAPFVVQVGNNLDYYNYNNGMYKLVKTTYPSAVTRTP